ncbi:MAG TPA: 3-isopropylmalate dehydratase small subunit [Patescibacteria group bacterium]|nr:3-isopropylmalate dehydratase small subunit [Patescibacteria group bacterium]
MRYKNIIRKIKSTAVPLPMENVDTDQIIPSRFLKGVTNEGYGEFLFRDWRFNDDGTEKENFVLNDKTYKGDILITGPSFGIGSSREHAAWAIADYGFRVVISSQFGDIFKNNSLNNFLLTVEVSPEFLNELFTAVDSDPQTIIDVDLENLTISIPGKNLSEKFDINPYKRMCLMNGYDDIDYILSKRKEIEEFEKNRRNDFSI